MICNTDFLKEQCDHDEEMINTMINMFVSSAPGYVLKMNEALKNRKFQELKDAAHAFLSSLKIMGAQQIVTHTQQIEHDIYNNIHENLAELTLEVSQLTTIALQELKASSN